MFNRYYKHRRRQAARIVLRDIFPSDKKKKKKPHRNCVERTERGATYRSVAEISDPAVQVRHLAHGGGHVASGSVVEIRLRERLFPVVEVSALRRRFDRTLCENHR